MRSEKQMQAIRRVVTSNREFAKANPDSPYDFFPYGQVFVDSKETTKNDTGSSRRPTPVTLRVEALVGNDNERGRDPWQIILGKANVTFNGNVSTTKETDVLVIADIDGTRTWNNAYVAPGSPEAAGIRELNFALNRQFQTLVVDSLRDQLEEGDCPELVIQYGTAMPIVVAQEDGLTLKRMVLILCDGVPSVGYDTSELRAIKADFIADVRNGRNQDMSMEAATAADTDDES